MLKVNEIATPEISFPYINCLGFHGSANSKHTQRQRYTKIIMVSAMKLSVTIVLLLSGLVVFGETADAKAKAPCAVVCFQGGHITCDNYPGQELDGCDCECAPADGKGCVLHLDDGVTHTNCRTPNM
ncbi:uncharacterized protein LOC119293329 [Triticum dicoccoides]|uniref:Uncharacterized protein n=3 Tax=Triticum TaxID=4564 RepID=A0A9R0T061_TRITD|nr:uncharacterized protein LOC119293329 [Triticum dicoccoides]VAI02172.1 unnamed protein product [Triticum turgidum subsp. durum]